MGLFLFFFVFLFSVMSTVSADEMFFVDFYVVDSHGTPLSGVEIEVTGIYGYDEFAYTGNSGYAPRLTLLSDQRNAHYTWTAKYQLHSKNGDFYVPNNYNAVNIVMSDVIVSTPKPSPTPTQTPTVTPSPTPTPTPSSPPTLAPTVPTSPTQAPTLTPTPLSTPSSTVTSTDTPSITPSLTPSSPTPTTQPSPTVPEFSAIIIICLLLICSSFIFMLRKIIVKCIS